jgi:hypothetical protein
MPVGRSGSPPRKRRRALSLLASLVLTSAAHAATFPNLYVVTVQPDPAATDQRAAATEAAFAGLLVRMTGNRYAALDPQLQPLIHSARDYYNSYGTDRQGRWPVTFNAQRVEAALARLNIPVWGPERPLTLLWIAVDDGEGGRAQLPANELPADIAPALAGLLTTIRAELAAVADERGLPILFPLLDAEDMSAATFTDVWGGFDDRVLPASARYRADAVLIGRVHPGLLGYEVEWLLLKDGERRTLEGTAVRDGLDAVADTYASELSVVGGATTTRLRVLDVVTPADYGRVMGYLETVSALQTVDVESLERGTLSLRVAARGDARVLERVLALGGVLRPDTAASSAGSLVFRIQNPGTR